MIGITYKAIVDNHRIIICLLLTQTRTDIFVLGLCVMKALTSMCQPHIRSKQAQINEYVKRG